MFSLGKSFAYFVLVLCLIRLLSLFVSFSSLFSFSLCWHLAEVVPQYLPAIHNLCYWTTQEFRKSTKLKEYPGLRNEKTPTFLLRCWYPVVGKVYCTFKMFLIAMNAFIIVTMLPTRPTIPRPVRGRCLQFNLYLWVLKQHEHNSDTFHRC